MESTPRSKETNIERKRKKPKGNTRINILLPKGTLYMTSNIKRIIAETRKNGFQSMILERKKNIITKTLKPKRANSKLSKYTKAKIPTIVKRISNIILKICPDKYSN